MLLWRMQDCILSWQVLCTQRLPRNTQSVVFFVPIEVGSTYPAFAARSAPSPGCRSGWCPRWRGPECPPDGPNPAPPCSMSGRRGVGGYGERPSRRHSRLAAQRFHLPPQVGPVQGLAASCDQHRPGDNAVGFGVFPQPLAQLSGEVHLPCLALVGDHGFPRFYGL